MNKQDNEKLLLLQLKQAIHLLEERINNPPQTRHPWEVEQGRSHLSEILKSVRRQSIIVDKQMYRRGL